MKIIDIEGMGNIELSFGIGHGHGPTDTILADFPCFSSGCRNFRKLLNE